MIVFICAFMFSAAATLLLVRLFQGQHGVAVDRDFAKPQRFHDVPVPRIGGLGILIGLLAGAGGLFFALGADAGHYALLLLACAAPAFVTGVTQDFTDSITPRGRLVATAISAVLAYAVLGAVVRETAIPGIDWLLSFNAGALIITVLAVAGIAHAVNIIDGFNGLAAMCVVLMLAAVAYVAFQVGDPLIGSLALTGIGAALGFFLWNFPGGLIFLGDGGAYFLGFFVSELLILLGLRNPHEVSPLFPLLVCIYPVFETVFSIYRRSVLRAAPPSLPDGIHLHSLIYRRVVRWAVGGRSSKALTRRNSMTSPFLWVLCMLSLAPAVLAYNNTPVLMVALFAFMFCYVLLYWRIVRFKSPRWMRVLASRPVPLRESDNRGT